MTSWPCLATNHHACQGWKMIPVLVPVELTPPAWAESPRPAR